MNETMQEEGAIGKTQKNATKKTKNIQTVTKSLKSNNLFKYKGKLTTRLFGLSTKRALHKLGERRATTAAKLWLQTHILSHKDRAT